MRDAIAMHAPSLAAFAAMVLVGSAVVGGIGYPHAAGGARFEPFPISAIQLPSPEQDADLDGFGNDRDLVDGDLLLWVNVTAVDLGFSGPARPYLVVGTQDDAARTGAGAELEWRHVVDFDPLGHPAGSLAWEQQSIRTGAWWASRGLDRDDITLGEQSRLDARHATLPQGFPVNVRDDRARVSVTIELWDALPKPDQRVGRWSLAYDVGDQSWGLAPEAGWAPRQEMRLAHGLAGVNVSVEPGLEVSAPERLALVEAWAPSIRFDSGEALYPTTGDTMRAFHGFTKRQPNLRTWDPDFNDGRDGYRLLVADFNGDRVTDHRDVVIMTDLLRAGGNAPDTVYAHAMTVHGGKFVVQFWFLYAYNFVSDESGRDIDALAHAGDREFMQLVFADAAAAAGGFPESVAYSQHYRGVQILNPIVGEPPFHLNDSRPAVYPARGSHASYPAAGDDAKLRSSLAGYGDRFDGGGEAWNPDDYRVELLTTQTWHLGYKWGPLTRFSRDLGISFKPLLQHDFRYPFTDPLHWQARLPVVDAVDVMDLYRTPEDLR